MNEKFKKKKSLSPKVIVFWSFIGLITVVLLTILIVKVVQEVPINSYASVEKIKGYDMFSKDDDTYYVLFYDFENKEENESFDKGMFKYLEYTRNNKLKKDVYTLYGMDSDEFANKPCLGNNNNIDGATKFPNELEGSGPNVLSINKDDLPVLLIIKDGEVSDHKTGENDILDYFDGIMNK